MTNYAGRPYVARATSDEIEKFVREQFEKRPGVFGSADAPQNARLCAIMSRSDFEPTFEMLADPVPRDMPGLIVIVERHVSVALLDALAKQVEKVFPAGLEDDHSPSEAIMLVEDDSMPIDPPSYVIPGELVVSEEDQQLEQAALGGSW